MQKPAVIVCTQFRKSQLQIAFTRTAQFWKPEAELANRLTEIYRRTQRQQREKTYQRPRQSVLHVCSNLSGLRHRITEPRSVTHETVPPHEDRRFPFKVVCIRLRLASNLVSMTGKTNPLYQLTRFALMGIPQDAVCSVDVTNQCNLRCHHCYFFEHEQPENLAVERWRAFFEKLKSEGFPFFSCSWVGGEPLMRQEIIEMGSKYFRRNMVVTNGTIRIPDWPHVNFKVSVDGIEARHDRLRGAKTYQRIKRMIRDAASRGLRVGIATVLTRENADELEQFVEEWKSEPINGGIIFE